MIPFARESIHGVADSVALTRDVLPNDLARFVRTVTQVDGNDASLPTFQGLRGLEACALPRLYMQLQDCKALAGLLASQTPC